MKYFSEQNVIGRQVLIRHIYIIVSSFTLNKEGEILIAFQIKIGAA